MNNLTGLLKITFINNFGLNAIFNKDMPKEDKTKALKNFAMMMVIGVTMIILVAVYANLFAEVLAPIGAMTLIPMMAAFITSIVTLFLSIFKADGILFGSRDYDFLMSLPLSNKTILSSKIIELLVLNFGVSSFVLIPTTIIYYLKGEGSILSFFTMFVGIIFLPLIPIIISSLIALVLNLISSKFRFSKILYSIGLVAVFGGFMLMSFKAEEILSYVMNNSSTIEDMLSKIYLPAGLFSEALINNNVLALIKFVVLSIIPFIAFVFIFAKGFKVINSNVGESYQKKGYKVSNLKARGLYSGLLMKEFKRYFSSTAYVFNTFSLNVMLVIMSVASIFAGKEIFDQIPSGVDMLLLMIVGMFCFLGSIGVTTPSSISIEGKNLWILKSLPLDPKDIFKGKILMSLILGIPFLVVSALIMSYAFSLSLVEGIFLITASCLYSVFITIAGLYFNLMYPKFEWKQEIQAVKNTMSVTVTMFTSIIPLGIAFLAFRFIEMPITVFMLGSVIFEIILIVAAWIVLNTKGVEKFNKL